MCLGSVQMAFIKPIIKVENSKPKSDSAESDIDFYTEVYWRRILKITSGYFQGSQARDCQNRAGVATIKDIYQCKNKYFCNTIQ